MINDMKILSNYKELLWVWTTRDIRVRYKQSVLGGMWAILQPLAPMIIFTVIFSYFMKVPTDDIPYPIFSYTALLPWTFFASSITFAASSLVQNTNLVTKIYFPREILPISAVVASFIDFLIAAVVFLGMMFVYKVSIKFTMILIPLILSIQIMLTLGIVLFTSAVNVFYRDIRFVVPLALQLWMYATPIIYPLSVIPEKFKFLYMLNPMVGIIESYRSVTLKGEWPVWTGLGLSALISIILFFLAYRFFKRVEWSFADIV